MERVKDSRLQLGPLIKYNVCALTMSIKSLLVTHRYRREAPSGSLAPPPLSQMSIVVW